MSDIWVLASGSREFWHEPTIEQAFRAIEAAAGWGPLASLGPHRYHLIHGACPLRPAKLPGGQIVEASADMLADRVARRLFWHIVSSRPGVAGFPADWEAHRPRNPKDGNPAGFIRNQQMIDVLLAKLGAKVCVGLVNDAKYVTPGTRHCTDHARKAGIHTWIAPMGMGADPEGAL